MKKKVTRLFSVLLAAVLVFGTLPVSALGTDVTDPPASTVDEPVVDKSVVDGSSAEPEEESAVDDAAQLEEQSAEVEAAAVQSAAAVDGYTMNIFFLDCGRKYYSASSIKQFIDNASSAGFNYIQLAVGNDGLRFLLDNMELTVNGKTYGSNDVKAAIQTGNRNYYNFTTNELTQSEMDEIISYAHQKGMGVIPCVNSPGHMDVILSAASSLTGVNCAYSSSARTIDITNDTAVAFTKAILQKYIDYFASKGCKYFNMGADEYANDVNKPQTGMGFGVLQRAGQYETYVQYINGIAGMIKEANMTPMAFNDGIYYDNVTDYPIDNDIVVCYWSGGWGASNGTGAYSPRTAANLARDGFKLINTNSTYYYSVGSYYYTCTGNMSPSKFVYTQFESNSESADPVGSMFCIWADFPGAKSETEVINATSGFMGQFGSRCPKVEPVDETPTTPSEPGTGEPTITAPDGADALKVGGTTTLTASEVVTWTAEPEGIVDLTSADPIVASSSVVSAKKVTVTALNAGTATITAKNEAGKTAEVKLTVSERQIKEETVTVSVGGTATRTVETPYDASKTYKTDDESIATVTAKAGSGYQLADSIENGTAYYLGTKADGSDCVGPVTFNEQSSSWSTYYTVTYNGQSLSLGTGYYATQLSVSGPTDNRITIYRQSGYYNYYYATVKNGELTSTTTSTSLYLFTAGTGADKTDVTFTGVKEGTTYATIGDTHFTIMVVTDPSLLTNTKNIELWITNEHVHTNPNKATDNPETVTVTAAQVNSAEGKAIDDLVPKTDYVHNSTTETLFWKGTRLTSTNKQSHWQADQTGNGDDFTKIRYWQNEWSFYSVEKSDWVAFNSTDQIVAYYLQRTDVTTAVTTYVKDWGTKLPYEDSETKSGNSYALLDFAVDYGNGKVNPNSFANQNTIAFHCQSGNSTVVTDGSTRYRKIGRIYAAPTENYKVYMITVTPSSDTKTDVLDYEHVNQNYSDVTINYGGTEKVVWVDNEANIPDGYVKSSDNFRTGGDPTVEEIHIYNKQAVKVTYYVKPNNPPETLHAYYYVDGDNNNNYFYDAPIVVNAGMTFKSNIQQDPTNQNGDLLNGDVQTVEEGVVYTVTANLQKMAGVPAAYRYAKYNCVKVEVDTDLKTVRLYYKIDTNFAFIADFGTPLEINLSDISTELAANKDKIATANIRANHGSATYDKANGVITNTPESSFAASENGDLLTVYFAGQNQESGKVNDITYTIKILPASNVLYEESFLSKPDGDTTWSYSDAAAATQETQKVGDTTKTYNVFGYDGSYSSSTNANGVWSITGLEKNKYSAPLTTEFYGNTFDLIGDCGPTTGGVLLTVIKNGANGKHATIANIDTRYDDGSGATIHQVPLAHIVMANKKYGYDDALCTVKVYATGLDQIDGSTAAAVQAAAEMDADAEYDALLAQILEENDLTMDEVDFVTISAADNLDVAATPDAVDFYSATYASDGTGSSGYQAGNHVEIDGFRVYRSTTDTVAENYPDNEKGKTYKNIWGVAEGSFVGFTDKKREATGTVQDYIANGGPQNEIYLTKSNDQNHAVVFKIGDTKSTIQVSLRAVKDNNPVTVNLGNGVTKEITSVTEMYYEVTSDENGVFTIANTGDGILAIGNVKLPSDNQIISAQELGDEVVSKALTVALYGNAEPEPEPDPATFAPETFETKVSSTSVIRNKVVTLKVTVSSDVAYITVNGKKYTRTGLKGFGGKNRTIRVVSVMPKDETPSFEIVAYNANGEKSETKTVSK